MHEWRRTYFGVLFKSTSGIATTLTTDTCNIAKDRFLELISIDVVGTRERPTMRFPKPKNL